MNNKILKCLGFFLLMFAMTSVVIAEGGEKTKLNKPDGQPTRTHFTINNISTWIWSNGDSDIDPAGNSGLVYPKGSGRAAVFETGFVWGGKVNGQIRVGGSTYSQGLTVGRILADGTAQDPEEESARIYRVRPDWQTGDVTAEMDLNADTEIEVRNQYQLDWNAWPAEWGAPYEDVDGNGSYDPAVDVPGVPGSHQTIWFVANDLDESVTLNLYGSPPMGIEMQATFWGYNVTGPLQNMLFRKYKIINKSANDFEDMYVSLWSDVDLGGAGDDYAGCDVDLSLGYCYNGTASDAIYGTTPPAVGFDYFQGPILPGTADDVAIFDGKYKPGYYNMPMTAFYFFINSDPIYSDPDLQEYATGTLQFYNLFQGLISATGEPFKDPNGVETKFPLSGDPLTGAGWIDGQLHPPGDRRFGTVSGPFTMYAGDIQEIVVAEIVAGDLPNVDNKSALGLLRFYDKQAQTAYDNFFQIANPPAAPSVKVTELDRAIVLNWGLDQAAIDATEQFNKLGYSFEGYNVYQLPNPYAKTKDQAKRIATFDVINNTTKVKDSEFNTAQGVVNEVVVQFGSDSEIKRSIEIDNDYVNNSKLYNGSEYYFAVTAYAVNPNPDAIPKTVENTISVLKAVPHTTDPGVRYDGTYDQILDVTHDVGVSEGVITPVVVDPSATTGGTYKVTFADIDEDVVVYNAVTLQFDTTHADPAHPVQGWNLTNTTSGQVVLKNQIDYTPGDDDIIVDGIQMHVSGPAYAGVDWDYEGSRWLSGSAGGELMFGSVYLGANFWGSTTIADGDLQSIYVEAFAAASYTDENGNGKYDVPEPYVVGEGQKAASYSAWGADRYLGIIDIPFKFYAIEADGSHRQLEVVVRDRNQNGQWDPEVPLPEDGSFDSRYNYIWVTDVDYNEGLPFDPTQGGDDYGIQLNNDEAAIMWTCWWVPRGTNEQFSADFTMTFIAPKVILNTDEFSFVAPEVTNSNDLAKEDVAEINVFPNPYYGINPLETDKYQRRVTFNHLPEKAEFRIFNLAGQSVAYFTKDEPGQFMNWDLTNHHGLPVASGIYIVYIDLPDQGETKILKLAIIQEKQLLDRY